MGSRTRGMAIYNNLWLRFLLNHSISIVCSAAVKRSIQNPHAHVKFNTMVTYLLVKALPFGNTLGQYITSMPEADIFNLPIPVPLLVFAAISIVFLWLILKTDPVGESDHPRPHPGREPMDLKSLPRVSYIELPELPPHLRYWGIRTEVVLEFLVSKAGKASQIRMIQASHVEMVRPCIEAVRHATFLPARNDDNEPVEYPMVLPIQTPSVPMPQQGPPQPQRPAAEVTRFEDVV